MAQGKTRWHGTRVRMYDSGFPLCRKQTDGGIHFHLDIPPQSPTVRGLASILANGLMGTHPDKSSVCPGDFFLPMNLQEAVSQQHINGFNGMFAHMKQEAVKYLNHQE